MIDLDYLEETIHDGVIGVIADNTDSYLISDDDVRKVVQTLTELVLDKVTKIKAEEEEESDTEFRGDMDTFPG